MIDNIMWRAKSADDPEFNDELNICRRQIDQIDAEIFDLLKTVGFEKIGLFGDKRMEAPRDHEHRWFIAARKPVPPQED